MCINQLRIMCYSIDTKKFGQFLHEWRSTSASRLAVVVNYMPPFVPPPPRLVGMAVSTNSHTDTNLLTNLQQHIFTVVLLYLCSCILKHSQIITNNDDYDDDDDCSKLISHYAVNHACRNIPVLDVCLTTKRYSNRDVIKIPNHLPTGVSSGGIVLRGVYTGMPLPAGHQ